MNGHRGQAGVLGIDLGTSGVKALVVGARHQILGRGMAGYRVRVPASGQAESDPEEWWRATRAAVREALAEADRVTVTAVGVAGQMHGVVLVDDRGAPLRPAILWLDQRATAEAASYEELPFEYTAVLGNRPSPGMAGPLLSWLLTHEPCTVHAAWWALQPKDWLRLRLTGQVATDPTDASGTLLFDLTKDTWAGPLIEKLGLPGEKLPPINRSEDEAGHLLKGPAADLGLPQGIPVATGSSDTAAALYAVGLKAGEAMLNLGSSGVWVVNAANVANEDGFRPSDAAMASTNLYRAVGDGCYRLASVYNVGVTLDWVRNLLGATWDELYDTAARPPNRDAPRFAPYLSPERWNPGATGAWTGLTLAHEREDLMRSALDGVAGLLRQRLDDLRAAGHPVNSVILGGGGITNPAWRALLAQVLDVPLRDATTTWLTPAGAARLAADAASGQES